ncbi:FkbM family methyltransferase [Halochromatium glycolicum]|uniref:Methyltransferase FkbM domain-containing protein n=1 Tax=Halochromatium glycolicum TaxID=85075 RepID=A0AAJ0XBH6_9GAMM|nr:FkbM family methyltransferase [Halochromatium glycolicum]MBK1706879.1 hypothetical protein [Halochromatium glycolicum]
MQPKRPNHLFDQQQVEKICDVGSVGLKIIEQTDFTSQKAFNRRRGIRIANILNDYFEITAFEGKKIVELGPGHYAFALLARHLGAEVVCVERDPQFISLGRHLGFEVLDMDFNDITSEAVGGRCDGLWVKGTFNACNYRSDSEVEEFALRLTGLVQPAGWAWLTVVNKTSLPGEEGKAFAAQRIEVQRRALMRAGWGAAPIRDEDRPLYALKYTGSPSVYFRNIPAYVAEAERTGAIPSGLAVQEDSSSKPTGTEGSTPSEPDEQPTLVPSRGGPFNAVQRLWKPTPEYFRNPWEYFVSFIEIVKRRNGRFITMSQALAGDYDPEQINVCLDHHIDYYPVETEVMCRWELENNIVSSVYLFNRFIYDDVQQRRHWVIEDLNVAFYQHLEKAGFEIGYHQNALGLIRTARDGRTYSREITNADKSVAQKVFAEDVDNLRQYFNIRTFIPHGGGEGNAQLVDLPDGYDDLIWIYNNARRNGACEPPLRWRNYSDSCGAAAQRIKGFGGQYVANVDNLHLNAYLMEPGLNHVLIHPGRFAKGMPYELYEQTRVSLDGVSVSYEFSGIDEPLPLDIRALVANWVRGRGETLGSPFGGRRNGRFFVISDDLDVIRNHMAASDGITPVLVYHRQISANERELFRVPRPIATVYHMPSPAEDFVEAFQKFYNKLFSRRSLRHLAESSVPLDVVYLTNVLIEKVQDLRFLVRLLKRAPADASVYLRINVPESRREEVEDHLERAGRVAVAARFDIAVCDTGGRVEVTAISKSTPNGAGAPAISRISVSPGTVEMEPSGDFHERLEALCRARGEDSSTVLRRFSSDEISRAPRSFSKHMDSLRKTVFAEAGVRDGLAFVRLPNGRIFYGHTSKSNHRRAFDYVHDVVPSVITEETYLLGLDIAQRYASDFSWPPASILPPYGGTLVECGAYLGHKTIRFADELVGSSGKVLAIEMMPDNVEILRRNVQENGLNDVIDIVEAGVWNEKGALPVKGKGRQRNTLLDMDKLTDEHGFLARVDTLDSLIEEWGQQSVDLVFMTINGAEVEALAGMDSSLSVARAIFVAAPYERNGRPSTEVCREIAENKGCKVLGESSGNRLYIVTPAHPCHDIRRGRGSLDQL